MGVILLFIIAAIVLAVIGGIIDGLRFLLAVGLILLMLSLIVGAARYLRTGWRR